LRQLNDSAEDTLLATSNAANAKCMAVYRAANGQGYMRLIRTNTASSSLMTPGSRE
jgi:hypothetical protein